MSKVNGDKIDPRYEAQMRGIAEVLDRKFNGDRRGNARQVGFVLLLFPFGPKPIDAEGHRTNYISNATREDVVNMLREQLAYFEGKGTVQ